MMRIKKLLNHYWALVFVGIPIILQIIFFYFPMMQGVFYSLTNWTGLTYNFDFVGLNNYKILLSDPKFIKSIGFTLVVTVCMVIGQIGFGIVIARLLTSKIKAKTFFRAWFFFPAVLSGVVVSLVFRQIFNYGLPSVGNALNIDFLKTGLLGTKWGAIFAVIFVLLWQGIAMPIIIFLAGFQSIPKEIIEAAHLDGANEKQIFWHIELTYLLPSLSMVFIMALKGGLTCFDQVFALTGGGPDDATTTLGLLVYNYAFKNNQFGYANAIALVLFGIIVIISFAQQKLSKKFEI